jgi:hypothetical protein
MDIEYDVADDRTQWKKLAHGRPQTLVAGA